MQSVSPDQGPQELQSLRHVVIGVIEDHPVQGDIQVEVRQTGHKLLRRLRQQAHLPTIESWEHLLEPEDALQRPLRQITSYYQKVPIAALAFLPARPGAEEHDGHQVFSYPLSQRADDAVRHL